MPRLGDYKEMFDAMLGKRAPLDSKHLYTSLAYVKAEQWRYEREWRIATYRDDPGSYSAFKFNPLELPAVYLGAKCSEVDRTAIVQLVKAAYPFTTVYQMAVHPSEFSLVAQPFQQ